MKARLPLIAALAVTLAPLEASAQAWVTNPDFSEGIGIRAGNFVLHPSVGAEFGYDSNFFRASANEGTVDVLRLRVTPSITLGNQPRQSGTTPKVVFGASAYAAYNELFPLDSENSKASKRRNVSLGADMKVDVNPRSRVGVDFLAAYVRVIDAEGRTDDLAGEGFNRDSVRGGGGVTWRPGGGLFEWRLGYLGTYHWFESEAYAPLNNLQHDVNMRGRWRFLPRSALLFDTNYRFIRYTDSDTKQTNGDALRSRIGFHGLVTYHLSLLGMIGWASSFYETRPGALQARQFDSVVANAEARWYIQPRPNLEQATIASGLSSIALGYNRLFSNSYHGSFYQQDRGYLQFSMFLLGAVAGGLEFGVSRIAFPDATVGMTTQPSFSQLRIDSRLFGEYRFTDTLAMNASLLYDQVNSEQPVDSAGNPIEDLDYRRFQAYVGVRWFM
jgi:hypothetical protein